MKRNVFCRVTRTTGLPIGLLAAALLGIAWLGSGCRSMDRSAPEVLASAVVPGNTPGQIHAAVVDVFQEAGFRVMKEDLADLTFEKAAGGMSDLAYGSWMGDTPVYLRVRLHVGSLGPGGSLLECQAFRVHDRGGPIEEEHPIGRMHRGPYQKLLDEIAARFRKAGAP